MIFNLIHRPLSDSEPYRFQRSCAHRFGFKTTVLIPTRALCDEAVINLAREDRDQHNAEIGLWLTPVKPGMNAIWLTSEEEKMESVKYSVDKYKELFGCAPKSVGNYVIDAQLMKMITDYCPECTTCVAGCFEEGVKVFHGCNNSWYLFSEGMNWGPWYPSKDQTIRPAENEEEWAGVVAVPHLSRDLVLGYEGRNDFFASHPANIQRGLATDGWIHEYDFNLVDQYRMQEDFNNYQSYYQMHVGANWFKNSRSVVDPDEVTRTLYIETLEYIAKLRDEGEVTDMHLSEFGEYYKKNVPIGGTDVAVGKDILYGSGKHYFWAMNPSYRVLIDTFQGGSIGDLRPFAGKYSSYTGPDSPSLAMNSYPYLIQSQYRTGVRGHGSDGTRTTAILRCEDETVDLCLCPSKIEEVKRAENSKDITLILKPVSVKFKNGLEIKLQTIYNLKEGLIETTRKILEKSDPCKEVYLQEYVKACYGFTEYSEDMKIIELFIGEKKVSDFNYRFGKYASDKDSEVSVKIPKITTFFALSAMGRKPESVQIEDGNLFSPYFVMKLDYKLNSDEKEIKSCLKIRKI